MDTQVTKSSDEFIVIKNDRPKREIKRLNTISNIRFFVPDGLNTGIEYDYHDHIKVSDANNMACYFEYGNIAFYSLGSDKYIETIRLLADIIPELLGINIKSEKRVYFNITDAFAITKDQFIIETIMYPSNEWSLYKVTWIGYDKMYSRNLEKQTTLLFRQFEGGNYFVFLPHYCPADEMDTKRLLYEISASEEGRLQALKDRIAFKTQTVI